MIPKVTMYLDNHGNVLKTQRQAVESDIFYHIQALMTEIGRHNSGHISLAKISENWKELREYLNQVHKEYYE